MSEHDPRPRVFETDDGLVVVEYPPAVEELADGPPPVPLRRRFYRGRGEFAYVYEAGFQVCRGLRSLGDTLICGADEELIDVIRREAGLPAAPEEAGR